MDTLVRCSEAGGRTHFAWIRRIMFLTDGPFSPLAPPEMILEPPGAKDKVARVDRVAKYIATLSPSVPHLTLAFRRMGANHVSRA